MSKIDCCYYNIIMTLFLKSAVNNIVLVTLLDLKAISTRCRSSYSIRFAESRFQYRVKISQIGFLMHLY